MLIYFTCQYVLYMIYFCDVASVIIPLLQMRKLRLRLRASLLGCSVAYRQTPAIGLGQKLANQRACCLQEVFPTLVSLCSFPERKGKAE